MAIFYDTTNTHTATWVSDSSNTTTGGVITYEYNVWFSGDGRNSRTVADPYHDWALHSLDEWFNRQDPVEQKILRERAWLRRMARRAARRQKEQAEATALALVRDLFELADADFIEVPSELHPGRTYRVPLDHSMVRVMEKGREIHRLCAHPDSRLPGGDHAIAKALWLETNEQEFLRVANRTDIS